METQTLVHVDLDGMPALAGRLWTALRETAGPDRPTALAANRAGRASVTSASFETVAYDPAGNKLRRAGRRRRSPPAGRRPRCLSAA